MGINHFAVIGRVSTAPQIRYTPDGVPIMTLRLNHQRTGSDATDTFTVTAWRKLAENVAETVKEGHLVSVEGRLKTRTTETPDGQRRKLVEVEANSIELIGAGAPAAATPAPRERQAAAAAGRDPVTSDPFLDVPDFGDDDSIPF
jgi:single-strand DNA-binding protein